jgi:hypothetical protein
LDEDFFLSNFEYLQFCFRNSAEKDDVNDIFL